MPKTKNNTRIISRDRKGRIKNAEIRDPERKAVSRRNNALPWSSSDVKMLSMLAKRNTPTRVIGLKLGRTEASVRNKAQSQSISLRPTNRSPNNGKRATK